MNQIAALIGSLMSHCGPPPPSGRPPLLLLVVLPLLEVELEELELELELLFPLLEVELEELELLVPASATGTFICSGSAFTGSPRADSSAVAHATRVAIAAAQSA